MLENDYDEQEEDFKDTEKQTRFNKIYNMIKLNSHFTFYQ